MLLAVIDIFHFYITWIISQYLDEIVNYFKAMKKKER